MSYLCWWYCRRKVAVRHWIWLRGDELVLWAADREGGSDFAYSSRRRARRHLL